MSYNKFSKISKEIKSKRDDILFIPHLYEIRWARTISTFMKDYFYCPIPNLQFYPYMQCRSETLKMIANILPQIRNNTKIDKVFFFNLGDDYNIELIRAGGIQKVYGILHSSSFMEHEFRTDNREQLHEKSVVESTDMIFVPSSTIITKDIYIKNRFEAIGLPILEERCSVDIIKNKKNFIIFNHRLNLNKNPEFLLSLPKKLKDRTIISIPSGHTTYIGQVKKEFTRFYLQPTEQEYSEFLLQSSYGFVASFKDCFPTSVIESIMNGILYFCLDNDKIGIKSYLPSECIFKNIDEFMEKIYYYDSHSEERVDLVIRTQNIFLDFFEKNIWIQNLINKIK